MIKNIASHSNQLFLAGGGECGDRIRAIDWADTSLGPVEQWPQSLRTSVSICLQSNFPICIYWGPDLVLLYNESWAPIPGNKHPWAMGKTAREVWPEIWGDIGPLFANTFRGEATGSKDGLLLMHRHGYTEECYFDFTFTPITGEDGQVGGVFNAVIETTYRVLSERRNSLLQALNKAISNATSRKAICQESMSVLQEAKIDLPFSLIYLVNGDGMAELYTADFEVAKELQQCALNADAVENNPLCPHFRSLLAHAENLHLRNVEQIFTNLPIGVWPEPTNEALVLPLADATGKTIGFFVAGISPRRALDGDYENFLENIAANLTTELNRVTALDEARRRSEQLAELDRAKTAFFTNISHEFRTPLTLILGPLEELIRQNNGQLPATSLEQIQAAHRNSLRLLRLVNMLLDFSSIESGRMQARYRPTDLATYTTDLASNFRSAMEKAGLRYEVNLHALPAPVYVDIGMWEKIVLNLVSNAFKYTHEGGILIALEAESNHAVLRVADTGIGIPEAELPHMFERFHRVQNAVGRTYEGSGIGLSLVRELVHLHGGEIRVESRLGEGSTFTVRIPMGHQHLPAEQLSEQIADWAGNVMNTTLEVKSIQLDDPEGAEMMTGPLFEEKPYVLVVDDNADMRMYMKQLLTAAYQVGTALNGREALEKIKMHRPDLVLSDIMMPVMDGIELLHTLKGNTITASIPVILLSARAGEEARVSGYDAGADDYLVKPFVANELLARVRAQLKIANTRRHVEHELINLFRQAPVAIAIFRGPEYIIESANDRMLEVWDKTAEQVLFKPMFEAIPDVVGQGFEAILGRVYEQGERFSMTEAGVGLSKNGVPRTMYFNIAFEPVRNEDKAVTGILAIATDVTEQVLTRQKVEESEQRYVNLLMESPFAVAIFKGENFVISMANDAMKNMLGKGPDIEGKPLFDVLHEMRDQVFPQLVSDVYTKGVPFIGNEVPGQLLRHGKLEDVYFNFVYQPFREVDGAISGVTCIAYEVTTQAIANKKIEQSEANIRNLFVQAPVAICVLRGPQHIVELMNGPMLEILGKDPEQTMFKPIFEGVPEGAGQGFEQLLDQVYHQGERYVANEVPAMLLRHGTSQQLYANLVFEPIRESDGTVSGVMVVVTEVTAQVEARQKIEENEARYRHLSNELEQIVEERTSELVEMNNAFENAEAISGMGNFKWDLQTNTLSWSKGMYAIYGLSPDTFEPTLENIMPFTHPEEVERVTNNALKALATQSVLPLGYRIIAADGQVKHVFGSGIILDDPTGRKILLGTLQDVSDEKEKEQQLLEVNEQLKENNLALEKSNRDLEQFAHIASHDLQEPLRKIQTFANLLQRRRDDPAELEKYTQKIEDSASRMSQLIQSVLNYSRVSQSQDLFEPTDLNQIIARIRTDFELVIEEKNAVVQSDDLPVIPGVPLQLSQLFSNLISNALKFSTEHPLITISVSDATPAEISARTPLDPAREYVHIWVEDNGIGFSQQYSERIFAIFQRLHDRQTYAGTGIGLALCKKIVDRHGGDISAQGEVGKGARFDIYLPKK